MGPVAYRVKPRGKTKLRNITYHFPDPFYDASAKCHARDEIDYRSSMLASEVPEDQRCGRPGCAQVWSKL